MTGDSIMLGAAVYEQLTQDDDLKEMIGNRVYPITVTNPDTPMPFIVYSRTNITPEYIKDGLVGEEAELDFVVVSRDYSESVLVASQLRKTLELKSGTISEINIRRITLESVSEDWYANTYWQILKFKFII